MFHSGNGHTTEMSRAVARGASAAGNVSVVEHQISDADFKVWSEAFRKMMASKEFQAMRTERGLFPFDLTGPQVDAHIRKSVQDYRKIASDFGLSTTPSN